MSETPTRPLARAYYSILTSFFEAGGAGDLDVYGAVTVGPSRHPMAGDARAWMQLVAHGLVAGERGKIMLTEIGRDTASQIIAGRTREAV